MNKDQLSNWGKLTVLPPIGAWLIRLLGCTMRIRTEDADRVDALYRQGQGIIIAFWHGQQLMMPLAYRGTEAHILISQHRDGELIHRIISRFGFRSVRGSTTRGGLRAMRRLIELGRSGVDLVVTPDGPKGPPHLVQSGVVYLAKATGLPIVPLTFSCSKKKSSQVGTISYSPTLSALASSCGVNPFGSIVMSLKRRWKPSDPN